MILKVTNTSLVRQSIYAFLSLSFFVIIVMGVIKIGEARDQRSQIFNELLAQAGMQNYISAEARTYATAALQQIGYTDITIAGAEQPVECGQGIQFTVQLDNDEEMRFITVAQK